MTDISSWIPVDDSEIDLEGVEYLLSEATAQDPTDDFALKIRVKIDGVKYVSKFMLSETDVYEKGERVVVATLVPVFVRQVKRQLAETRPL
ncbi:hypothetical protein [Streptomyces olivochromogenes]|uniref:Uncharacterized protein n=1 Tax=Streptomyces olivochromogenes TaxID=1963 RepID=A0A250VKZ5_STROL|nr:hypothetical protein [Streptomyces olivochromogenes]GAX54756.1 hypothetical protein SO3561_06309 [Streptomyces olivochromogenes]